VYQFFERLTQGRTVRAGCAVSVHYHQINAREALGIVTKHLANDTFESVPVYRPLRSFLGNCQTQPARHALMAVDKHCPVLIRNATVVIEHLLVIRRIEQSGGSWKTICRGWTGGYRELGITRRVHAAGPLTEPSGIAQALSRTLPLRRRAASTALPPRVAFLARKPCVRARLILLG